MPEALPLHFMRLRYNGFDFDTWCQCGCWMRHARTPAEAKRSHSVHVLTTLRIQE